MRNQFHYEQDLPLGKLSIVLVPTHQLISVNYGRADSLEVFGVLLVSHLGLVGPDTSYENTGNADVEAIALAGLPRKHRDS
jgi:hypothetical protein